MYDVANSKLSFVQKTNLKHLYEFTASKRWQTAIGLWQTGRPTLLSKDHHLSLALIYVQVKSLSTVMQHIHLILKICSGDLQLCHQQTTRKCQCRLEKKKIWPPGLPFGVTSRANSFMNKENNVGLNKHPCFRPCRQSTLCSILFETSFHISPNHNYWQKYHTSSWRDDDDDDDDDDDVEVHVLGCRVDILGTN